MANRHFIYATPARLTKFRELWVTHEPREKILEILNAMPGFTPIPSRTLKDWAVKCDVKRPLTFLTIGARMGGRAQHDKARLFAEHSLAGENLPLEDTRGNWTSARLRQFDRLYKASYSTAAMASELGCTKCAVIGKSNRLVIWGLFQPRGIPRSRDGSAIPLRDKIIRAVTVPRTRLPRPLPLPDLSGGIPQRETPLQRAVPPVSGVQTPPTRRIAYGPPPPPRPTPTPPPEPVVADWPTIMHWAGQRGITERNLERVNAKRAEHRQRPFEVETPLSRRAG